MTVIANRLDGIVREMTNTLLRAARSAVISSARDFSCCILTGDNQLLASAEGLPVHIFGAHLQGENMRDYHAGDIREGDAYLDNDPYGGNTHPADHTFLVPVFIDGEHLFTTVAKCHMADIGNSIPSSYFAKALDVYEEGALVFPGVRIQRNYKNEPDIIRMCRARIRVPDQWYGDALAGARLGADRRAAAQGAVPANTDRRRSRPSSRTGSIIRSGVRSSRSASCRRRGSPIPASPIRSKGSCPNGLILKVNR